MKRLNISVINAGLSDAQQAVVIDELKTIVRVLVDAGLNKEQIAYSLVNFGFARIQQTHSAAEIVGWLQKVGRELEGTE